MAIVALMQSCSQSVYNNEAYIRTTNLTGKKVAILPVDVEFTGKLPKGYTSDKKKLTEESESSEIQNLIYREYLYRAKRGRKKQKQVELINIDHVNSRLRDNGISVRESWAMHPDSLAKLVGADLVMRVRVKKDRIMSDAASLGIGVATTVLDNILSKDINTSSVGGLGKTYNIFFDATLTDASTGTVISKVSKDGDASWKESPESVIRTSSGKMIRRGAVYAQY